MTPESRRLLCEPSRWMVTAAFRRKLAEGNSSPRITRLRPGRFLLLLALLIASWPFSAVAQAATIAANGNAYLPVAARSSIPTKSRELAIGRVRPVRHRTDSLRRTGGQAKAIPLRNSPRSRKPSEFGVGVVGIDCITLEKQKKQPSQDSNNFPDSPTDLDDTDGGLDDLSADSSACKYRDTPLFSVTGVGTVTLRTPRIVPILLFPVHCFYCLHKHIRERAPPIPPL
jgi:hypothetical protein